MDNREVNFLEYNIDNTMKHALAIEDHARNLSGNSKPEHVACISKHSLQLEEQTDEGISHATIADPDKVKIFKEVRERIYDFRKSLTGRETSDDLIPKIRSIRKVAEKLNPRFNTASCRACSVKRNHDHPFAESESLNTDEEGWLSNNLNNVEEEDQGDTMASKQAIGKIGTLTGYQLLAGGVEQFGLPQIDIAMGMTASPAYTRPSVLVGALGGLALAYFGATKSGKLSELMTVAGTHMAANAILVAARETTGVSRAASFARPIAVRPNGVTSSSPAYGNYSAPSQTNYTNYSNGVIVD